MNDDQPSENGKMSQARPLNLYAVAAAPIVFSIWLAYASNALFRHFWRNTDDLMWFAVLCMSGGTSIVFMLAGIQAGESTMTYAFTSTSAATIYAMKWFLGTCWAKIKGKA